MGWILLMGLVGGALVALVDRPSPGYQSGIAGPTGAGSIREQVADAIESWE
jgi:hypothetical protein